MNSKKSRAYGVDSVHYERELYDAMNTFTADIPFYEKWARKQKGKVLELCCGTGRITLPLKEAGVDITGVDFMASMLEGAELKARAKGLRLPLFRQDMRKLRLPSKFGLIFIPFNSIQNTYKLPDLERVFAGVKRHLRPGGKFLFDIFNPSITLMYERSRKPIKSRSLKLPGGEKLQLTEKTEYVSSDQVLRVFWTYQIGKQAPFTRELDMRCLYPQEIDALLKYNGFRILKKFGSFKEEPFGPDSSKQIFVCEVAK